MPCLAVRPEPKPVALMIPGIGISYLKTIKQLRDLPLFRENCVRAGIYDYRNAASHVFEDHGPSLRDRLDNQKMSYVVNCTTSDLYKNRGIVPDFVVGYSMGLYAALYAGGYYSFETGLGILEKAFSLVRECCLSRRQKYGMAIILGFSESEILGLLFQGNVSGLEIAVYNGRRSFVIAGEKEKIDACLDKALELGAFVSRPILTEHPYHSSFLRPIADEFLRYLHSLPFFAPSSRVFSLIDGTLITRDDVAEVIVRAMHTPLHLDRVVDIAVREHQVSLWYETGPAKSMSKLIRYINRRLIVRRLEKVEDR